MAIPSRRIPCSSAPFTLASSAFSRKSASASAEPSGARAAARHRGGRDAVRAARAASPPGSPSAARALGHDLLPERQMADQPRPPRCSAISAPSSNSRVLPTSWRIAAASSRSEFEPRVQRAGLLRERRDGHRVLEQPAEVGVVARARAGARRKLRAEAPRRRGTKSSSPPQVRVVDLAREVLEEAVELLHVAVRHGQELGGIARLRSARADRAQRRPGARRGSARPARSRHEVAALELAREEVRVAKGAAGDRAGAVAQLDARDRALRCGRSGGPCGCRRTPPRPRRRRAARRWSRYEPWWSPHLGAPDRTSGTVQVDDMDRRSGESAPSLRGP